MKTIKILTYLFALWLFVACNNESPKNLVIAPPFQGVSQESELLEVDPTKESVARLKNGTTIQVPKDAFIDASGSLVTKPVKLAYKQFTNAAEIIASGIPMTFTDENGQEEQLESAGMFELTGTVEGKSVQVAKGKSLQVNMASPIEGDYDFFYLEPDGTENNRLAQVGGARKPTKYSWKKLTAANPKQDFVPIDTFKLQFDTVQFPEMKALAEIDWLLATDDSFKNPNRTEQEWMRDVKWENVELTKPEYTFHALCRVWLDNSFDLNNVFISPDKQYIAYVTSNQLKIIDRFGDVKLKIRDSFKETLNRSTAIEFFDNHQAIVRAYSNMYLLNNDLKVDKKVEGFSNFYVCHEEQKIVSWNWQKRILSKNIQILDYDGKLVKNIDLSHLHGDYRSVVYAITNDARCIIVRSNRDLYLYNLEGKQLATKQLKENQYAFVDYDNQIKIVGKNRTVAWNWGRDKLLPASSKKEVVEVDSGIYWVLSDGLGKKIRLEYGQNKKFNTHPKAFLLRLQSANDRFNTVVYITENQLEVIRGFQKERNKKLVIEGKRVEEEQKIFRAFSINNFGVYNWDRFYKQSNRIQCKGEFSFEGATGLNDIKVFHVCGENGNAVIYYYDGNWDKFTFRAEEENQLLAVLPGNKIALFSKEEFEKLDIEQIKKTGRLSISFKASTTIKSVDDLKKALM